MPSRHRAQAARSAGRTGGAIVAAALTAVVLTGVSMAVDHGRRGATDTNPTELTTVAPDQARAAERAPAAAPAQPAAPADASPAPAAPAIPPAPAVPRVAVGDRVLFVADYATGDFSQWGTCQSALLNGSCTGLGNGDRAMRIIETPIPGGGRFAAQFTVKEGDIPEFGGGERSEVSEHAAAAATREGDERWYEWSMRLPADFAQPTGGWFIVMQWHAGEGSPPLAIDLSRGSVDIGGDGVDAPRRTIGPLRRGEWVHYVLHVKFSRSSSAGFVEAWENGTQTVPRTSRATMTSDENYLKQGIYRDEGAGDGPAVVQLAGLRVTAP